MAKLNLTSYKSRWAASHRSVWSFLYAALVVTLWTTLDAGAVAQAAVETAERPARITAIVPNPALVGGTVRVQLAGPEELAKYLGSRKPVVFFDSEAAELEDFSVEDLTLIVKVPTGIPVNSKISVSIGPFNLVTDNFRAIPGIDDVRPATASAGSQVTLIPNVALSGSDKFGVRMFSQQLEIVESGTRSIVIRLPDSITTATPELTLWVNDVRGEPFLGLKVVSESELASARSPGEWFALAIGGAGLLIIIVAAIGLLRKRLRSDEEQAQVIPTAPRPAPADKVAVYGGPPIPDVPGELAQAIAARDCVLFAGGGLSVAAGFPTWEGGLESLLQRAADIDSGENAEPELMESLTAASPTEALELLLYKLGTDFVHSFVEDVYGRDVRKLPKLPSTISALPFAGVITTNWDDVVTKCFGSRARPRLATDWEHLAGTYRENEFFLIKLHGDAKQSESLVLTPTDYSRVLEQNGPFRRFVTSLYATKTFFFVGSSRQSIDQFLSELPLEESQRTHYALVPYERGFSGYQQVFESKYRVKLLGYEPTIEHLEVIEFVDNLKKRVAEVEETLPEATEEKLPWLQRIVLENIGPFESLDLELKPGWNILLGDNGCGKSMILRAVALGLCSPDHRVATLAGNLLRFKQKRGSVSLTIGGETYTTKLQRESGRVRVDFPKKYTPLESGDWLALGFPALRGVSNYDPTEPSTDVESRAPATEDLLPLLSGEVDTRMNEFKQWIYNAYMRSLTEGDEELEKIFNFLESVTPGIRLTFGGIDENTMKILVRTNDGDIPLDQLSQGTASIIGVAGYLLQRLNAVFKDRSDKMRQPALAIVDEIGAHMHPAWQYSLASLMERNFENLQIIGATHSPLVLGSIEDGTIFRMKRIDGGGIQVKPTEKPLYGWLAEDIYEFMGIEDTRAEGFRVRLNTFKQLDEMRVSGSATQTQLDQLEELRKDMANLPGEDPVSLTMELDNLAELLNEDASASSPSDSESTS